MDIRILASGSSGNAYTASDGHSKLLLDAGIPVKQIQEALHFKLNQLDGVLVTHEHGDHVKAAKKLADKAINVYATEGTIRAAGLIRHRIHRITALKEFVIKTFKVLPFPIKHDAVEPVGYLITSNITQEKLLYVTDTQYIEYRFSGLTHIMMECNYDLDVMLDNIQHSKLPAGLPLRIINSHMSIATVLDFLKANDLQKLQQIYLLHLSDANSDEEKMKLTVQRLTGVPVYVC